jgi:hypothetical protein
MIKDNASLAEIVNSLPKEQQEEFHKSGLHGVISKFGIQSEDRKILRCDIGNLIIADDVKTLVHIPIKIDLFKPVLLVGAFKWRLFDDNLEIHI